MPGARLVSSLSQAAIGADRQPRPERLAAEDGSEVDDNQGCPPLPRSLDSVNVGSSSQNPYFLQRECNNAAAIEFDPNTYRAARPP